MPKFRPSSDVGRSGRPFQRASMDLKLKLGRAAQCQTWQANRACTCGVLTNQRRLRVRPRTGSRYVTPTFEDTVART